MRLVKAVPRRRRWCGDTSARATERFSCYRGGTLRIQLSALTSGRPTDAVESSKSVGCNPLKAPPFKFWAAQRREFASPSQGVKRSPQRNEESCCWASDIYLKSLTCWAEFGTSSCIFLFIFYIFFTFTCHTDKEEEDVRLQAVAMVLLLGSVNANGHSTGKISEKKNDWMIP